MGSGDHILTVSLGCNLPTPPIPVPLYFGDRKKYRSAMDVEIYIPLTISSIIYNIQHILYIVVYSLYVPVI